MSLKLAQTALVGGELALSFEDGREFYLPLAMLRRACPCAVCQGEPDALGRVVRPKVEFRANSFEMTGFQQVGGYALQLSWADGHSSGIYTFDYLIRLANLPADES